MKYTGRLAGTLIILTFLLLLLAEHVYLDRGFIGSLLFGILLFPLLWKLGEKYDNAKFLSEKDSLTQIYNRRFIQDLFPRLIALANRKNEKLSLSVIDIDNFKAINDTYGHEQGDKILRRVSKSLIRNSRQSDIVVRWGGDEFIVLAPSTDQRGAEVMMKRFEASMLKRNISVSIGTSIYPDDAADLHKLIEAADQKMYKVKAIKKAPRGGASCV